MARPLATAGTAVMRMADAELLPFDFDDFADTVHIYIDELKKLLKDQPGRSKRRNQELDEGVFTAIADPKKSRYRRARPFHLI